MSNPFEDNATTYEEVPMTSDTQSHAIAVDDAYNTTTTTTTTTTGGGNNYSGVATNVAVDYATASSREHISNAYDATIDDINTANANTADHHPPPETPAWCVRFLNWLPLRWFLFGAGAVLMLAALGDMALNGSKVDGIGNLIFFYLFCVGIMMMVVEGPVWRLTRGCQLGLFFWFRLVSRLWGRACFYIFIAILCFVEVPPPLTISLLAGIILVVLIPIMFLVSRSAAQKYQRIFVMIAAGTEGEARDLKFEQKFDELDTAKTGFITSTAIVQLATQAGRNLSNSERHAIQTFLDASCNGKVSKEDFLTQFRTYNLKQRFL